ncbi:MAG: bifunctional phosphopantothenoylcysteine decarboxylase/phosphopantothenate--cysteine ligase CoaBC [Ignavibacteriaceae bacterium]
MQLEIFKEKKIVIGITGCIAAYKSCYLIRELIKRGASVKAVMTPSATQFIQPLTISSLTGNQVIVNIFPQNQKEGTGLNTWHIDLAMWADLIIIAPATVNTVAKIAYGFADNALTTLICAARSPVLIAPAADVDMYLNPLTLENLKKLESLGYYVVHAEAGELASGLTGKGRFASVEKIIDSAELNLSGYKKDLNAKKILVTAGPTYEDIDPVRFIGNRSSGKMGFAIAKAAYLRGADVTLISGPSSETEYPEIRRINVRSAEEMKVAVEKEIKVNEILIMSAAVADFKPERKKTVKIKRSSSLEQIKLKPTADILAGLKKDNKLVAGFALETNKELSAAKEKMKSKNLDLIVFNSLIEKGAGFEADTNKVTILRKDGKVLRLPVLTKFQTANKILSEIIKLS